MVHIEVSATDTDRVIENIHIHATVTTKEGYLKNNSKKCNRKLQTLQNELEDVLKGWFNESRIWSDVSLSDEKFNEHEPI